MQGISSLCPCAFSLEPHPSPLPPIAVYGLTLPEHMFFVRDSQVFGAAREVCVIRRMMPGA